MRLCLRVWIGEGQFQFVPQPNYGYYGDHKAAANPSKHVLDRHGRCSAGPVKTVGLAVATGLPPSTFSIPAAAMFEVVYLGKGGVGEE